jgi:hypothetical protein
MYIRYTALDISYPTDRAKAILGLESRLALFYNSPSVYGVLTTRAMFGRTLLWGRSGTSRMKAISGFKTEKVPSWSWMSVMGQITYLSTQESDTTWMTDFELALPKNCGSLMKTARFLLTAPLSEVLSDCRIELRDEMNVEIRSSNSRLVGWIRYDGEDVLSVKDIGFVTIAQIRDSEKWATVPWGDTIPGVLNYGLVIGRIISKAYCRLGVAVIQEKYLRTDREEEIFIL